MAFVTTRKNLSSEPAENWDAVEYFVSGGLDQSITSLDTTDSKESRGWFNESLRQSSQMESVVNLLKHTGRPSGVHSLHDVEANEVSRSTRILFPSHISRKYSAGFKNMFP